MNEPCNEAYSFLVRDLSCFLTEYGQQLDARFECFRNGDTRNSQTSSAIIQDKDCLLIEVRLNVRTPRFLTREVSIIESKFEEVRVENVIKVSQNALSEFSISMKNIKLG